MDGHSATSCLEYGIIIPCAQKIKRPEGTFDFQAMGCHGLPWVAGIMHREAMARQRELAWILRLQNHYTITAGNIPLLF